MKKCTPTLICLLLYFSGISQTRHSSTYFNDSTLARMPWSKIVNSVQLSTGALWDHAVQNEKFNFFDGKEDSSYFSQEYEPDTLVDYGQASLFQSLIDYESAMDFDDTSAAPTWEVDVSLLDNYLNLYNDAILYYNAFPLVVYDLKYNQVDSAALIGLDIQNVNGYFQINSNTSVDSLFPERNLFQLKGMHLPIVKDDTIPVVFAPGFLFVSDSTLGNYEINFGDGNGFVSIQASNTFKLYYPDSFLEEHTIWTLRKLGATDTLYAYKAVSFHNNSGSGFSSQSTSGCAVSQFLPDEAPWPYDQKAIEFQQGLPTFGIPNIAVTFPTIPIDFGIESSILVDGKKSFAKAYVKYGSQSGLQNKEFRKPLIIVDGIDFARPYDWFSFSNYYNNLPGFFQGLKDAIQIGQTGWPMLWGCGVDGIDFTTSSVYIQEMLANGYDIIFLDFWDSTDDMKRNAMVLVELIERVNANKVGNEEIVLIGASMGGQIARYALSYMEHNNLNHCVRLNVSFDSPWNGAVIPLGVQSFVHYAANATNNSSAIDQWRQLNDPAPKQLLFQHLGAAYSQPNSLILQQNNGTSLWASSLPPNTDIIACLERQDFLDEVNLMGNYPSRLRNVAILNGAGNNNNQNNAILPNGSAYINHNDNCLTEDLKVEIYSVGRSDLAIGKFKFPGSDKYHEYRISGLNFWEGKKASFRDKDISRIKKEVENSLFQLSPFNICSTNIVPEQYKYGFIPSLSALHLNSNDPDFIFDNVIPKYGSNLSTYGTHFDAYYSPLENQSHIRASNENMLWLLEQTEYGSNVEEILNGTLDKPWNIPLEKKEIGSFNVISGGKLNVYHLAPRFDGSFTPLSTFGSNIVPPSNFEVSMHLGLDKCTAPEQIHIFNGGEMNVGDEINPIQVNKVQLHIEAGSSIIVDSQGKLEIDNLSQIIVHENATLDLRSNSTIKLNGQSRILIEEGGTLIINGKPNFSLDAGASIIIKGKLKIEDNSHFYYNGNGTIQFEQSIPFVNGSLDFSDHYSFGQNAKFRMIGTSGNRPQLKVLSSCYLRDNLGNKANVQLINVDVEINPNELLYLYDNPFINNITIDVPANTNGRHQGLRIWGDLGTTIVKNSTIRNGSVGIWAQWAMANNPIFIQDCIFENNITSLKVEGGSFSVYNCDFSAPPSFNTTGIRGVALQSSSALRNCNFAHFNLGADFVGTSNSTLDARNNTFLNCDAFESSALSIQQITARLSCNSFLSNSIGITIGEKAQLFIDDNAYNVFNSNNISIRFTEGIVDPQSCGLFLKDGKNQFLLGGLSATAMHIQGTFDCQYFPSSISFIRSIYSSSNPSTIDAAGNFMEERQIVQPNGLCCVFELPVSLVYKEPNNGPISGITCTQTGLFGLLSSNTIAPQCALAVGNEVHPLEHTLGMIGPEGGKTNSGGKLKDELIAAIRRISYGDSVRNDKAAFNQLAFLSSATITSPDGMTSFYQELAYSTALTALENAYHSGQLTSNDGQVGQLPDSTMQNALGMIDYQIVQLDTANSDYYNKRFIHHLNQILILRNGGYTDEALAVLGNSINWTDPNSFEQSQRIGYWQCIIGAEDDYYQENISIEEWADLMNVCKENFVGYNFKNFVHSNSIPSTGLQRFENTWSDILIYPQPATDHINIEWEGFKEGKEMGFTIHSINGIKLKYGFLGDISQNGFINVADLMPGVYILSMQSEGNSKRETIIIE